MKVKYIKTYLYKETTVLFSALDKAFFKNYLLSGVVKNRKNAFAETFQTFLCILFNIDLLMRIN